MKFHQAKSYQPKCKEIYQHYKTEIKKLLSNARAEHIGSFSIPNCISKGDLDIFVGGSF